MGLVGGENRVGEQDRKKDQRVISLIKELDTVIEKYSRSKSLRYFCNVFY